MAELNNGLIQGTYGQKQGFQEQEAGKSQNPKEDGA